MPAFAHIIGIDYSGAKTPTSRLKGLRVYLVGPCRETEQPSGLGAGSVGANSVVAESVNHLSAWMASMMAPAATLPSPPAASAMVMWDSAAPTRQQSRSTSFCKLL